MTEMDGKSLHPKEKSFDGSAWFATSCSHGESISTRWYIILFLVFLSLLFSGLEVFFL